MSFFALFFICFLVLEIAFRVFIEIREVRLGGALDSFAFSRCIPIINDLLPSEANPNLRAVSQGAFVRAHEKAHKDLHHSILCYTFKIVCAFCLILFLTFAMRFWELNWFELLFLFHIFITISRLIFHVICFIEEYEADSFAVEKVHKAVALRALDRLIVEEYPRSPLFAFIYRSHPTAKMRKQRIERVHK